MSDSRPKCTAPTRGHKTRDSLMKCPLHSERIGRTKSHSVAKVAGPPPSGPYDYLPAVCQDPSKEADEVWKQLTSGMRRAPVVSNGDGEPAGVLQPGSMHVGHTHYVDFTAPGAGIALRGGDPVGFDHCTISADGPDPRTGSLILLSSSSGDSSGNEPATLIRNSEFCNVDLQAGPDSVIRDSDFVGSSVMLADDSSMSNVTARVVSLYNSTRLVSQGRDAYAATYLANVTADIITTPRGAMDGGDANDITFKDCHAEFIVASEGVTIEGTDKQVIVVVSDMRERVKIDNPNATVVYTDVNRPVVSSAGGKWQLHPATMLDARFDPQVARDVARALLCDQCGIDPRNTRALDALEGTYEYDKWGRITRVSDADVALAKAIHADL